MSNVDGPSSRVRGLVGQNIAELMQSGNMRQEDLAGRIRSAGAADWSQETVSRYVKGSRSLTLEDCVVLAAALGVPVVRFLAGDCRVLLNGSEVEAAQVRDVLMHGRVLPDHADGTVLDALAARDAAEVTVVEQQLAATLQIDVEVVVRTAFRLWDLPPDEELQVRMRRSRDRFTGGRPDTGLAAVVSAVRGEPQVTQRQLRAWRGHHVATMAEELAEELTSR